MPARTGTACSLCSGALGMATDATTAVPTAASRYINARAITARSVIARPTSSRSPSPSRCRRGDFTPSTSTVSDRPNRNLSAAITPSVDECSAPTLRALDEALFAGRLHRLCEHFAGVVLRLPAELLARLRGVHHNGHARSIDPRELSGRERNLREQLGG